MSAEEILVPVELKQLAADTLGIRWIDGHESKYRVRNIRLACRCANCVDEWTKAPILKPESVPESIRPKHIESVGRYAFKIVWSDGHDTGIFTFEQLRSQCECNQCQTR